jgi:hypothetical protein
MMTGAVVHFYRLFLLIPLPSHPPPVLMPGKGLCKGILM